jgi:hypothetical protein
VNSLTIEQVRDAARELAENLLTDIPLCKTREEHIRVTARANAAAALYNVLISEGGPLVADEPDPQCGTDNSTE